MPSFFLQSALIFCVCWSLRAFFRRFFIKSTLHDLPGPPPPSFIAGNLEQLFSPEGIPWHHAMSKKFGGVFKVYGLFGDERVYISDPQALESIFGKDQTSYDETPLYIASNGLMFGDSIFSALGEQHKRQRRALNPLFRTSAIQNLAPIFYRITHQLRDELTTRVKDGPKELDMLDWVSRNALEYIGQGGLGYSFDAFAMDDSNEYTRAVKDLLPSAFKLAVFFPLLPFLVQIGSRPFRRFLYNLVPSQRMRKVQRVADTMYSKAVQIFEGKRRALLEGDAVVKEQVGEGKDIMSVLLKANMSASEADRLPDHEIIGQMNALLFAANDTSSSVLSRILWLLASQPEAQARLRKEVSEARAEAGGDLGYDELMELPYLDAVVRESLRLYPPLTFTYRTTLQDTVLPLSTPITSTTGAPIHSLQLTKGTELYIGIATANRHPGVWGDDAEEWKPERWIGKTLDEVTKAKLPGVYSGIMTFIGGGRACVGYRFSLLELKIVLSILLDTFKFETTDDIIWKNGTLAYPTTAKAIEEGGGKEGRAMLPMKVELLR